MSAALRLTRAAPAGSGGAWLLALPVAAFIVVFLAWPVATVLHTAFADGQGGFTTGHISAFLSISLMREAFVNSVIVAIGSVAFATLIAVPLAYLTVRFEFRGAALVQTLGVLPLVMPPFVGAVALQLLFGRNGSINLLLDEAFGFRIPFMDGLYGVVFVEGLHYFPFILLNLVAALRNVDGAMEEAAQNLGSHGLRLFRRVVFPLRHRDSSPARRWCSSRCSTISERPSSSTSPTCSRRRLTCGSRRWGSRIRSAT